MTDNIDAEGRAWRTIHQPAPRGRYEHSNKHVIRMRKRQKFLRNLRRDPATACWVWVGSVTKGNYGDQHPTFYHWRGNTDNTTRSAFMWMMREWFPSTPVHRGMQTDTTCGNNLCISPYHRFAVTMVRNRGQKHHTKADVMRAYKLKGTMSADEAAAKTGINAPTIRRIWSGQRWSSVTGQENAMPRRLGPDKVRSIYASRSRHPSMRSAAQEYGVGINTVRAIWMGEAWTEVTGAGPGELIKPRVSPETRDLVVKLKGSGRSAPSVAAEVGVSTSTVRRYWGYRKPSK